MTLHAARDGEKVTIHGNIHLDVKVVNGQVSEFAVTEDAGHVRSFWGAARQRAARAGGPCTGRV